MDFKISTENEKKMKKEGILTENGYDSAHMDLQLISLPECI